MCPIIALEAAVGASTRTTSHTAGPSYAIHPSKYIEGFPADADAPALGLSFGAADYNAARSADDGPVWSQHSRFASPRT